MEYSDFEAILENLYSATIYWAEELKKPPTTTTGPIRV
jgi:hypothetical protein